MHGSTPAGCLHASAVKPHKRMHTSTVSRRARLGLCDQMNPCCPLRFEATASVVKPASMQTRVSDRICEVLCQSHETVEPLPKTDKPAVLDVIPHALNGYASGPTRLHRVRRMESGSSGKAVSTGSCGKAQLRGRQATSNLSHARQTYHSLRTPARTSYTVSGYTQGAAGSAARQSLHARTGCAEPDLSIVPPQNSCPAHASGLSALAESGCSNVICHGEPKIDANLKSF